jgi:two-component system chemotaxis response regulator CheY
MALRDQLRILVVDDMSTSRGLLLQALDEIGIRQVGYASDAASALGMLEKAPVHLVISDFNMPGMDGLQLLQKLRGGPKTRGVGFILITGRPDRAVIEQGQRFGMNNFLPKPFTPVALRNCIEAVVGRL